MRLTKVQKAIILLSLISVQVYGQQFQNDASEREKHFVASVKQIDEFFDRFNDAPNSFIRKVYESYKTPFKISRDQLIRSLFNYESNTWNKGVIDSFVTEALKVEMPTGKNWYGNNWFAEVTCKFKTGSTQVEIPLLLQIFTDERKRSKWVIVGINSKFFNEIPDNPAPNLTPKVKFINPSSHGTNFSELERDFEDKEHLSDFFNNELLQHQKGKAFYNALSKNELQFSYVKAIKYHFLNVSDYVFSVEYFPRMTSNSGWLINDLKKVSESEKEDYRKHLFSE